MITCVAHAATKPRLGGFAPPNIQQDDCIAGKASLARVWTAVADPRPTHDHVEHRLSRVIGDCASGIHRI